MRKILYVIPMCIWLLVAQTIFGQNSGIINYDVTHNWLKKLSHCKNVSKTDADRAAYVWGGDNEWTSKSVLKFNAKQSVFKSLDEDEDDEEYCIYKDWENNRMLDMVMLFDKKYAIDDTINCISWRIRNGMKEVAGHICMSAFYYDSLREKEIVAWFALDIPMSIGPDIYCGLPGAILELDMNNGAMVYTATAIIPAEEGMVIEKPVIKKKRNIITLDKFRAMEEKAILESAKMKRPYYWNVNY